MKIKQFFLSFITDTETPITSLCGDLLALQMGVRNAPWKKDSLLGVVELFNSAAEFEDEHDLDPLIKLMESVNYGQLDETVLNLKSLHGHLVALRKYNNQKAGEKLTATNVSIGLFSGLNAVESAELLAATERDPLVSRRLSEILEERALLMIPCIDYLIKS